MGGAKGKQGLLHRRCNGLEVALLVLGLLFTRESVAAASYFPLVYSARLTNANGSPIDGPLDVDVKFYTAETGGTQLGPNYPYTGVFPANGVINLNLNLMPAQVQAIFGDGSEPVFIEITAGDKTYPRQKYSYVPLALRIPVDGKTLSFGSDGTLGLALKSLPATNQFLTKNAGGELVWGTPAAATASSIQGQTVSSTAPQPGQVLTYSGTEWVPQTLTSSGSSSGTLAVPGGGTGATSFTNNGVLVGAGAGPISATAAGVQNNVLVVGASGPEFGPINLGSPAAVTGVLPRANGGTGADLSATGGAGHYLKQTTSGGIVTVGTIPSADITTSLGYTPLNKAGDTVTGDLSLSRLSLPATAAPALSSTGQGRIYFDQSTSEFKVSENGGAYTKLVSGGSVTSVNTGNGLTGGPITSSGTISLSTTGVTPNTYARATIAVDAQGRITEAASGGSINLATEVAGTLAVASGGTGATNFTANGVVLGNGAGNLLTTGAGSADQILRVPTAGGVPSFGALNLASSSAVSGVLPLARGGTGVDLSGTGGAGQFLKKTSSSGAVTVAAITADEIPALPATKIPQATNSTDGYLGAADWTTFNAKQNALGYTPLNKAGDTMTGAIDMNANALANAGSIEMAASKTLGLSAHTADPTGLTPNDKGKTWFNENTSQIKYWDGSAVKALGIAGVGVTSLGGVTAGEQSFGTSTSGTTLGFTPIGTVHTLNIPMASAGAGVSAGLISNTDYTAFSNKVSSVSAGTGIAVSPASGTVTVSLANVGTAGTYAKVITNAQGQVISSTTLAAADIPELNAARITSGQLAVAVGGTGSTIFNLNGVLLGNGTGNLVATASPSADQVLRVPSAGGQPSFGAIDLSKAASVGGILDRSNGGTGVSSTATFPASGVVVTRDATETLTNKTITGATINGASSIGGSTTINTTGTAITGALTAATITSQGDVTVRGNGTNTSKLVLNDKANTNFVAFKAPDTLASQLTWELPGTNGLAGQVLSTNGTGTLSWVSGVTPTGAASGDLTGNFPGPTLAAVGTAGNYTKVTTDSKGRVISGATLEPSDLPPISATSLTTGTLAIANGGTGVGAFTNNGVVIGSSSALSSTAAGSQYNILTVNASNQPTFGTVNLASTNAVNGTLGLANGGTGANLASTGGAGQFLKQTASGAAVTVAAISASEVPALPATKIPQATTSTDGYLSATDWTTFNNKQAAGSYLTGLTGDVTASGPGSAAASLSTTGIVAGTYAKLSIDAKGRALEGLTLEASDIPPHSASLISSGTLSAARGGIGIDGSSAANGQLLIGNGTGFTLSTLTAGTGVTINNTAGAITINASTPSATCPTGYVLVPKDDKFSFKDFCVMKYEAKKDGTTGLPVSTAAGTPFVSISWYEAKDVCQRVGAHLVTEGEWMTMARNIEATAINDIDSAAGIQLATGHSKTTNTAAVAAATEAALTNCTLTASLAAAANASCSLRTDTAIYNSTGQSYATTGYVSGGANNSQMRTHVLSNGNVIWDLSGNVWEWTDMQCTSANWYNTGWVQWDNANVTDWEKKVAGPSGALTSANGAGQYYGCTAAGNALLRGAAWYGGSIAGLFAVYLGNAPTYTNTYVGLRCALQP